MKKLYDRVPREILIKRVHDPLPTQLKEMIAFTLQPAVVVMEINEGQVSAHIAEGVQQGSPLSSTLFNIYMDTFAEEILGTTREYHTGERGLILFADDVKIFADSPSTLNEALRCCDKWATKYGMV